MLLVPLAHLENRTYKHVNLLQKYTKNYIFCDIKILWKFKVADSRKISTCHFMETVNQLEFQIRSKFCFTSEGINR